MSAEPIEPADAFVDDASGALAEAAAELAAVGRALERLDAGTYADCEVCGTTLEELRLEREPTLARCPAHL